MSLLLGLIGYSMIAMEMDKAAIDNKPPLRILLAESSVLVREGLRQILTEFFEVNIVGEPKTCADLRLHVDTPGVDLLLLDLDLPGTGIMETLTLHKKSQPGMQIIVMSQSSSTVMDRLYLEAGADLVLPKTIGLERLVEVIGGMARGLPSE